MIDFILGQFTFYNNRGLGYIIVILVFVAIFSFDKIVKLIVYLVDKIDEKRNRNRNKDNR